MMEFKENTNPTWQQIFEANTAQLMQWQAQLPSWSRPKAWYARGLLAYFTKDLLELESMLSHCQNAGAREVQQHPELTIISHILVQRLAIRRHQANERNEFKLLAILNSQPTWDGEISFVLAMSAEVCNDNIKSKSLYMNAERYYIQINANKKALTCRLNSLVAESRLEPEKNLVLEYMALAERARKLSEKGLAGTCFLNISREYQLLGAKQSALRFANKAMVFLKLDLGCLQFDLALVHRADVLLEMGRTQEARYDIEQAIVSLHGEVKGALAVLFDKYHIQLPSTENRASQDAILTPTWKERAKHIAVSSAALGSMEENFLRLIGRSPRTRYEIMEQLYGNQIDIEARENRFKNLLARVRKKRPDMVIFENGRYRLSDVTLLASASGDDNA